MRVVLFGASGMVGSGVLLECLADNRVASVLVVGRSPCGLEHPKLREVLREDFFDFSDLEPELAGTDACFFCLGVSSAGMAEARYRRLTYDLTMAAATSLHRASPGATFCFVSGAGTAADSRMMWARVKAEAESSLLDLFETAYMFRPGFIQPRKGVRSKTRLYQAFYTLTTPLLPLLRRLAPGQVTTTDAVGRAMIEVAANGHASPVLETRDINIVGAAMPRG